MRVDKQNNPKSVHMPILYYSSVLLLPIYKAQCLPHGTARGPTTRRLVLVHLVLRFLGAKNVSYRQGKVVTERKKTRRTGINNSPKCNTCKQRACYTCVAKLVKSAPCGWPIMRWPCPTCRTEIHVLTTDVKSKQMLRALLPCAEARTNDLGDFVGMAFDRNGALTIVQRASK